MSTLRLRYIGDGSASEDHVTRNRKGGLSNIPDAQSTLTDGYKAPKSETSTIPIHHASGVFSAPKEFDKQPKQSSGALSEMTLSLCTCKIWYPAEIYRSRAHWYRMQGISQANFHSLTKA